MIINRRESTATLAFFMKMVPRCLATREGHLNVLEEKTLPNMSPNSALD
jgi:hypothetical protein